MSTKNSTNQLEDLQNFWDKMQERLKRKYNASGPTEVSEQDTELPLKEGTLVVTFPNRHRSTIKQSKEKLTI